MLCSCLLHYVNYGILLCVTLHVLFGSFSKTTGVLCSHIACRIGPKNLRLKHLKMFMVPVSCVPNKTQPLTRAHRSQASFSSSTCAWFLGIQGGKICLKKLISYHGKTDGSWASHFWFSFGFSRATADQELRNIITVFSWLKKTHKKKKKTVLRRKTIWSPVNVEVDLLDHLLRVPTKALF